MSQFKLTAATKAAAFAVFKDAENSSASFTERLLELGIGDKATAKPLAMEWAAAKYKAKITQGQRGDMLPRNSDAERAMYRVLAVCFPSVDTKPAKAKTKAKADLVAKLLADYAKLSAGEKRSFKAQLAAL